MDYISFCAIVPLACIGLLATPVYELTKKEWQAWVITIFSILLLINQIFCFVLEIVRTI